MAVCPVCQKDNPSGVEYCEDCGASLDSVGASAPTGDAATVPAPSSSAVAPDDVAAGSESAATGSEPSSNAITTAPPAASSSDRGDDPAGQTAGGRPRLLVKRHGALTGEEVPLLAERLVVGRFDPETGPVDLDLSGSPEAQHISRQHAELYREADGRWFVRDLGSTNGVFVRDGSGAAFEPRITAPRALSHGDELAFGNARFVFQSD